jgi:hypothetical protein
MICYVPTLSEIVSQLKTPVLGSRVASAGISDAEYITQASAFTVEM